MYRRNRVGPQETLPCRRYSCQPKGPKLGGGSWPIPMPTGSRGTRLTLCAHSWQAACDFPDSIKRMFKSSDVFGDITALLILPEHRVPLPGGSRPSQNDVWVLARCGDGLVSVTVEGKARETFGPQLGKWREGASPGKQVRLAFLLHTLGFSVPPDDEIRYQLLHRMLRP